MGRLFTYGCSFTRYLWPTWADILHQVMPGENWALSGGGNKFIFESLIESLVTHNINNQDTIIIMWSSWAREDRYSTGGWKLAGNVYNNHLYDKNFLQNHWSDEGAIYDSLNWICAAHKLLTSMGCNYYITSAWPLFQVKEWEANPFLQDIVNPEKYQKYFDFLNAYNSRTITDNLFQPKYKTQEILWKKVEWTDQPSNDPHPLPIDHFNWICENLIDKLSITTEQLNTMEHYAKTATDALIDMSNRHGIHPNKGTALINGKYPAESRL